MIDRLLLENIKIYQYYRWTDLEIPFNVSCEGSDGAVHLGRLIKVFAVSLKKYWTLFI